MHALIPSLLLIALVGRHTDARLSGNRELQSGLQGLQTNPPTSANEMLNGQANDDPDALLGSGGHGQQITDPSQFDESGNGIYGNSPFGAEDNMGESNFQGTDPDDLDDTPLLGGGGHGQQITDPNQFDENGDAIYGSNPIGDGNGFGTNDPDDTPLLGGGGHGQQITDPNQFDENGDAIYGSNPIGDGNGFGTNDPDDTALLGGGGHGQQVTDPSQFDENGDAIYGSNPIGDGNGFGGNGPDDTPLLGGGGHGQQITDPNQFDENGDAIYDSNPIGDGNGFGGNGPDDTPLLGGGGHGQQITDPNQFDENGDAIYDSNPMNISDVDAFDGTDVDSNMTMDMDMGMGMDNMTMDMDNMDMDNMDMDNMTMDMMDGMNDTDSGSQNSTGLGGDLPDIDSDANVDDEDEEKSFPWDNEGSSAPSPAIGGSTGGAGFPSYYFKESSSPSPAPFDGSNFGIPTYGQNPYTPSPTFVPSKEFSITTEPPSSQNSPTWDYPKPSSKPVVYIPPEEKDNDYTGGNDDFQGGTSIEGTGGIGDYIYFDHGEPIEEMEHDRNVAIALGICSGIGLCLAIITAQQMLENPNGCCAGMCRILVAATCGVTRCICFPCRMICGCTGKQERYSNELISGGGYNEEYISDLELT